MTKCAARGQVDEMRGRPSDATRVAQRTIPSETAGRVVRRPGRCAVIDRFMADRTIVLRREMTLHAMRVLWAVPTPAMRGWLRTVVALHARIFFVAHAATLPVPRRL